MAKISQPKKEETFQHPPYASYEDVVSEPSIQSEIEFLTELLSTQVNGSWHGPAAGLIKERLKLLNGE